MTRTSLILAVTVLALVWLGYAVWTMQGDLVATHEALFDLQQAENARKRRRKAPTS